MTIRFAKKTISSILVILLLLCSCNFEGNGSTSPIKQESDKNIIGKWIDVETEQIVEYTESGFYYEYINENFTTDKTRYKTENGKVYYYFDGDEPDMTMGIDYEIKDGHLFVAGAIEYKPMTLKTQTEETTK